VRVLKSIAIGSLILIVAAGCFVLATKLVEIPLVKQIPIYYDKSPIENVFLVLITVVIAIVMVVTGVSGEKYKITTPGLIIFVICIVLFGLFSIRGLISVIVVGKVLELASKYYGKKASCKTNKH